MKRKAKQNKSKAPVRSQSVSRESKRGAIHFQLSEGSNCLHAGRTRGFCFLHSERQGQKDRPLRAGQGSRGRTFGTGDFFGEGCLTGQPLRLATVRAMTECVIVRITKADITRVIHEEPAFAELFIAHLLARNSRVEADLVDQLFNSSEKRLARMLLLLANFGKEGQPVPIIAKISQETLAEMIGTTRSRVSFFMNKFRELGFVKYNGQH